jgi:hypothetical protein
MDETKKKQERTKGLGRVEVKQAKNDSTVKA